MLYGGKRQVAAMKDRVKVAPPSIDSDTTSGSRVCVALTTGLCSKYVVAAVPVPTWSVPALMFASMSGMAAGIGTDHPATPREGSARYE